MHFTYQFIIKIMTQKEMCRVRYVRYGSGEVEMPCPLWVCHPPSNSMSSPTQKLPEPHHLGFLMEVSLRRYGSLSHWSLLLNSVSSPSVFPRVGDEWGGTENSNLLITGLVLSPTIKINSGRVERSFLWISKNTSVTSVLLDIPSVLEALCWERGQRSNQCISYITI